MQLQTVEANDWDCVTLEATWGDRGIMVAWLKSDIGGDDLLARMEQDRVVQKTLAAESHHRVWLALLHGLPPQTLKHSIPGNFRKDQVVEF